jgi:hypothetical protein
MQELGMADSGSTGNQDFSSQIDEDDPLMELSRIIGLEPRRETVSRYAPAPRPQTRIEPNFSAPVDTEALEMPASPEMSDVLQKDLAEELIASLESEDDFSALEADEEPAAPAQALESGDDARTEPEAPESFIAGEPVPHIDMSAHSSGTAAGSLEDELEAILNPSASRHVPFGLRPVEEAPEALATAADEDFEEAAAEAQPVTGPVMTFEDEIEPAPAEAPEEAVHETAAEPAPLDEQAFVPEPVKSEPSDYWSRVARRAAAVPAYVPDHAEAAAEEEHYQDEEPAGAPLPAVAAVETAPVHAPQFEPLVDIIAHEARGVEVTGDLDVPEFAYEAEETAQSASVSSDEYDGDYAPSYQQNGNASYAPSPSVQTAQYEDEDYDQINEATADLEQERDYGSAGLGQAAAVAAGAAAASRQSQPRRDFVLDDEDNFGASLDVPLAPVSVRRSSGRSYLMAAGLGALALVGGIGAFALTRGGGDGAASTAAAPVVLKADSSPVKVAPETPGGKVVPNQDIAVFDKAAGDKPADAAQTELVSKTETPVDLAAKAAPRVVLPGPAKTDASLQETDAAASEPDPGVKSEERIAEQPAEDVSQVKSEVASVSPKKVRTMVVKSDGTLEERAAAPVEKAAAPDPVETAMAAPAESVVPAKKVQTSAVLPADAVGTVAKTADPAPAKAEETAAAAPEAAAAEPAAEAAPAAAAPVAEAKPVVKTVKVKKLTQKAAKAEALKEVAAANIPLVDGRPSDQPVTIVAKTGKTPQAAEEVAALAPAPAGGSGGYVIQIASAPSPESAQATWASLNRKFSSVIGGRNVKIQKADIPGKGTFYRVRIAAGSKADAAALCAKYKSAGGQCLVAK